MRITAALCASLLLNGCADRIDNASRPRVVYRTPPRPMVVKPRLTFEHVEFLGTDGDDRKPLDLHFEDSALTMRQACGSDIVEAMLLASLFFGKDSKSFEAMGQFMLVADVWVNHLAYDHDGQPGDWGLGIQTESSKRNLPPAQGNALFIVDLDASVKSEFAQLRENPGNRQVAIRPESAIWVRDARRLCLYSGSFSYDEATLAIKTQADVICLPGCPTPDVGAKWITLTSATWPAYWRAADERLHIAERFTRAPTTAPSFFPVR